MIEASNLISDYFAEVRVKNPSTADEVESYLNNLYKKTYYTVDRSFRIERVGIEIAIELFFLFDKALPGVEVNLYKDRVDTREFNKLITRIHGWHVVNAIITARHIGSVRLRIEPASRLKTMGKPSVLYHVAPVELENIILKRGLKPRQRDNHFYYRYNEPRVYFFIDPPDWSSARYTDKGGPYVVFSVDTKKFSKFNLYYDKTVTTKVDAGYTLTHIPPSAIKVHGYLE